jgi:hypothetical protein
LAWYISALPGVAVPGYTAVEMAMGGASGASLAS